MLIGQATTDGSNWRETLGVLFFFSLSLSISPHITKRVFARPLFPDLPTVSVIV